MSACVCVSAAAILGIDLELHAGRAPRGTVIVARNTGFALFRLMRPEHVATSPAPLSSDVFTGFSACKYARLGGVG